MGETQIGGADFGQLISGAQAGKWQGERVNACQDDDVHQGREVVEDKCQCLVDEWDRDEVIVIKDECEVVFKRVEVIDQTG